MSIEAVIHELNLSVRELTAAISKLNLAPPAPCVPPTPAPCTPVSTEEPRPGSETEKKPRAKKVAAPEAPAVTRTEAAPAVTVNAVAEPAPAPVTKEQLKARAIALIDKLASVTGDRPGASATVRAAITAVVPEFRSVDALAEERIPAALAAIVKLEG